MTPIEILKKLGLLNWSNIYIGIKKGWATKKDAIEYAVGLLQVGCDDDGIGLIAGGEQLEDDELIELISQSATKKNDAAELDKWRMAYLISVVESGNDLQSQLDKLQEVYANFNYPEDMAACSIYSQSSTQPLIAMEQVVKELKHKFGIPIA